MTVALALATLVVSGALVLAMGPNVDFADLFLIPTPVSSISPIPGVTPPALGSKVTPPATLRVLRVIPSDGSQDVGKRSVIKVIFNRPMVDLEETSGAGQHLDPLLTLPEVEGRGSWVAANVYQFRPRGLDAATRYTVTVPAGLADLYGGTLPADHVTTFSTVRPSIVSVEPGGDARSVDPGGEVRMRFSIPMNRRSVEARFTLMYADGESVGGRFHWADDRTVIFTPYTHLTRSALCRVTLSAGAYASGKDEHLGIAAEQSWQFQVAGPPHLVSSSPADGEMAARPKGRFAARFNVPMDTASVEKALHIEPEPENVDVQWKRDDTRMEVYVEFDPSAEYRILLGEGARDRYGEPLTGNRSVVFRRAPLPPSLSLYGPYGRYQEPVGSYVADQSVEQFIEVRNLDVVTLTLSSVEPLDFVTAKRERYRPPNPRTITRTQLHTWTQSLDPPLNRIRYVRTAVAGPDGHLPPGLYLLEARAQDLHDARFMVVSRANLALKWGPRQVFVWATDVISGQVIPDMEVAVYRGDGTLAAEGVTDQDGVFVAEVEGLGGSEWQRWEENLFVIGDGPHGLALCASRWDAGITPWDFDLQQDSGGGGASAGYLYTDRPIYRPGQTVHFKGVVRADDDGRYTLLNSGPVTIPVRISDSRGNELYSDELALNEFGTFHGDLELSETAPLGRYTIHANLPGRGDVERLRFTVAEYRKPEFEVDVSAEIAGDRDRPYAVHGEVITVVVQADYYFGQPVPDTEVRWRVRGSPYRFSLPGTRYSFGEYVDPWWYYGEERRDQGRMISASGRDRTDEEGRFVFTIPVDLSQSEVSQVLEIEASLTDANNQEVTGQKVVVAHKTDTYLGVRPRRYVGAPGAAQEIDVIALDMLKEPRADLPVTVEFYSRRWHTVREETEEGGYVWRNTVTETLVSSQVVTTTADGTAQATVTPSGGGEYKVVARTLDGLGNESVSSTYLWVWGRGYVNWGVSNHNRVRLVTDKREYEPGDTAEILVTAPFSDCLALITIERGGVLSHEVQRVEGTSGLLEVPILADYAPNAFVSVSLLKNQSDDFPVPIFRLGYAELHVTRREQQLDVSITPDRERYRPGDTAIYTIHATDYRGRGVSAELSVGVVDAAVLALLGDNAEPILDAFYHRRGLGVWNAQTLVVSVERLNESLEQKGKGGGGGVEEGGPPVRRYFRDTAYWDPVVVTNQSGWATVRVPLPDDLTTWRLRAKAVTADTRVGDDSVDVISTKDLLVRPVLPRFFTVGDEATVAALVHNYTGLTQTVQVEMEGTGLQVASGKGQVASSKWQVVSVQVAPGGAEKVSWDVTVPKVEEAKVLFSAWATDTAASDAVEITLPVHAFAETRAIAASQNVPQDERLSVAVELPDDADERDEIIIDAVPSLGAGIRTGLGYLTGYPYG